MKKSIYIFIILSIAAACMQDKDSFFARNEIVKGTELLSGWKTYTKPEGDFNVNMPSNWNPKKNDDALLYIPLQEGAYFVVLNYPANEISLGKYLKFSMRELLKSDKKYKYNLTKINFTNGKTCYVFESSFRENNKKYFVSSFIYEADNKLYDFSYKTVMPIRDNRQEIFYNVIFSAKEDNSFIVDSEKFVVEKETPLKYSDIEL